MWVLLIRLNTGPWSEPGELHVTSLTQPEVLSMVDAASQSDQVRSEAWMWASGGQFHCPASSAPRPFSPLPPPKGPPLETEYIWADLSSFKCNVFDFVSAWPVLFPLKFFKK